MGVRLSRLCVSWLPSWPFPPKKNVFVGRGVNVACCVISVGQIRSLKVPSCRQRGWSPAALANNCEYRSPVLTNASGNVKKNISAPQSRNSSASLLLARCVRVGARARPRAWLRAYELSRGEKNRVMSLDRKIIFSLQSGPAAILELRLAKLKRCVLWV